MYRLIPQVLTTVKSKNIRVFRPLWSSTCGRASWHSCYPHDGAARDQRLVTAAHVYVRTWCALSQLQLAGPRHPPRVPPPHSRRPPNTYILLRHIFCYIAYIVLCPSSSMYIMTSCISYVHSTYILHTLFYVELVVIE